MWTTGCSRTKGLIGWVEEEVVGPDFENGKLGVVWRVVFILAFAYDDDGFSWVRAMYQWLSGVLEVHV